MAPTTSDELRRLLARHGLPVELAERAVTGLALIPGGTGQSKLGGRPYVAAAWPTNNGRALTHLASIALEELPDVPMRSSLPREGTVVFFVDLSFDNEGWSPATASEPTVEIVHVPTASVAAAATPPDEQRGEYEVPVVLNERRVQFMSVLTLPAEELYEALDAHDSPDDFLVELHMPEHLVLGEPEYIQGDPREPGEVSVLQLNWDEELGFMYGDGGEVSFYGSPEDLQAGRWERIKVAVESS
jgi:uncharacterized protein YwqG